MGISRDLKVVTPLLIAWILISISEIIPRAKGQVWKNDIQSFGARCDGSDDSGAVNAALRALPSGGTLLVPCRASIGPAGIQLQRREEITIEGSDGGGFAALGENSSRTLFSVEACNRCTIRNLLLDSQGYGVVGLRITNSTGTLVASNTVTYAGYPASAAIIGTGNHGNIYRENTVVGTGTLYNGTTIVDGTRGIWLGNPSEPLIEWEPVIVGNVLVDIGATGIAVNGVGARITDNLVDTSKGAGVKVAPPRGKGGVSLIEGNTLRRNLFHGVQIENADSAVHIRYNSLVANTVSGVYVSGGAFIDGEITGNTIAHNGQVGIYLYDANRVVIRDNYILGINGRSRMAAPPLPPGTAGNGIVMEALYSDAIQNLQIDSNTITAISGNGVALWGRGGTIRNVTLQANAVSEISLYGVAIEEKTTGAITGASLIANCFANNGKGTLLDARTFNPLTAPPAAISCPVSTQPGALRPVGILPGHH